MARLWLVASLLSVQAWADCPSGTRVQMDEYAHRDCTVGGRVTAYQTECYDQNDHCVGSFMTVGDYVYPCSNCYCYPEPDTTVVHKIDELCGETVDCGDGKKCGPGEGCCNQHCIPPGSTCCGDGYCPNGAACANGKCCPDSLPVYDGNSGYCCGSLEGANTGTICECSTQCGQGCCGSGKVCCDGGWCASAQTGCPSCPLSLPTWCPDGTCAPLGAVCCGGGYYCPNGRACVDQGGGQLGCDSGITPAKTAMAMMASGSPPAEHTSQKPSQAPIAGTAPMGGVASPNPTFLPGCRCDVASRAPAPWMLFAFSALLWRLRRRRVR